MRVGLLLLLWSSSIIVLRLKAIRVCTLQSSVAVTNATNLLTQLSSYKARIHTNCSIYLKSLMIEPRKSLTVTVYHTNSIDYRPIQYIVAVHIINIYEKLQGA